MHPMLEKLIDTLETTGYFLVLMIFLANLLKSILNRFVFAIEPTAKRKDTREKQETPIRLLLALSHGIAWTTAIIASSVIMRIQWFEQFFPVVTHTALLIGAVAVVIYLLCLFDKGFRKTVQSLFGYWYIKYHQKLKKGQELDVALYDGSIFSIAELFPLHATGSFDGRDGEFTLSNADILIEGFLHSRSPNKQSTKTNQIGTHVE